MGSSLIGTHLLVDSVKIRVPPHGVQQDTRCLTGSILSKSGKKKTSINCLREITNAKSEEEGKSLLLSHWPTVAAAAGANADDLGEAALVDDGSDVLLVALAKIVQDVAQARRHLRRQLGVAAAATIIIIIRQHLHQLGQLLLNFGDSKSHD